MLCGWIRSFLILCGVAAAALPAVVTPARACSLAGNQAHALDPQAQATDTSPPSAPVVTLQTIQRGKGPEYHGCAQSASSCDDLGWIIVQVSATDDETAVENLGYRVELAGGSLPAGLALPTSAVRPAASGGLMFDWIDGRSDDQEGLAFVLSIRAVDLAGNEGPPTSLEVRDPGSGGCAVAPRGPLDSPATVVAALLVVAGLLRRRRPPKPR